MSQTKAQLLDGSVVSVAFSAGTAGAPSLTFTSDSNTGIYSPGADQVAISTAGSGRLFVNASGRVGVGTSSPGAPVNIVSNHSVGTLTTSLKLATVGGYAPSSGTSLDFGVDQGDYSTWLTARIGAPRTGDNFGGSLVFYTNRNTSATDIQEAARIDSSGRVGIGVSSPGYLLDVGGNARIGNAPAATNVILNINGVANKASRIAFQESNVDKWLIGNGAASENGNFEIYDAVNGNNFVITHAGRVGIGTSSVSELLQVSKTGGANIQVDSGSSNVVAKFGASGAGAFVGSTSNDYFQIYSNNTARIHVTSAGLVGIGTTSPASLLNVNGDATAIIIDRGSARGFLYHNGTSATSDYVLQSQGGPVMLFTEGGSNQPIKFSTNGTERFRISSTGAQSSVIPGGSTLYPSFDCRAWVNFNGQGSVAIRGSGNVSSITDNGTGDYTVNFTTAMPDANYAVSGCSQYDEDASSPANMTLSIARQTGAYTASSVRVSASAASNASAYDQLRVCVAIFR